MLSKNLKVLLASMIALAFSACTQGDDEQAVVQLSLSEFAPYVQLFEEEAAKNGHAVTVNNLIIRFGSLPNPLDRGLCSISGNETPVITIDEDSWAYMSEASREALLFHELGHCVLRRVHSNNKAQLGYPSSVMNAYTLDPITYDENREEYMDELFSKTNEF